MRYSAKNVGGKFVVEVDGVAVGGDFSSIEEAAAYRDSIVKSGGLIDGQKPEPKALKKSKAVKP